MARSQKIYEKRVARLIKRTSAIDRRVQRLCSGKKKRMKRRINPVVIIKRGTALPLIVPPQRRERFE
jgi:hypothetical protein